MNGQPIDLFVFTHAHWFYWAITAVVILGSMAVVNMMRPAPQDHAMMAHTATFKLLESGQVDESLDTETLLLIQERIVQTIEKLKEAKWGIAGENAIQKHNALLEQLQRVVNKRHGVDGMTPLAK